MKIVIAVLCLLMTIVNVVQSWLLFRRGDLLHADVKMNTAVLFVILASVWG